MSREGYKKQVLRMYPNASCGRTDEGQYMACTDYNAPGGGLRAPLCPTPANAWHMLYIAIRARQAAAATPALIRPLLRKSHKAPKPTTLTELRERLLHLYDHASTRERVALARCAHECLVALGYMEG